MKTFTKWTFLSLLLFSMGWTEVKHLTLEQAEQIALENNYSLKSASKKVISASEKIKEAKAGYLPTLSLNSSYTRLDEAPTMMGMTLGDDDIYEVKTTLTQQVFTGGKLSAALEIAELNCESAQCEYERVKNELILAVKSAYFGILKALKFQQVATDAVKQVEAHLRIVHNLYDAGMVAKVDLLKAEVQLANTKQNLVKAENAVILAKAVFNQILAQDQTAPVEVVDILEFTPYEINLETCIKETLQFRPELNGAKENINILKQMVKLVKSDFYPSVAMTGNYDYKKQGIDWEKTWLVEVMANYTLWDWDARRSRIKQAEANLEAMQAQQLNLSEAITLEVRQAYLSLDEANKNIEVAQQSIGQAEESLRITEEMYKEGATTNTDVLDSQTMLTQSRTNYYQALYDYHLAWARLQKAVGTGFGIRN
ncbi:MAG: TolC family protein [Candidatus Desantisbacteria bacterium]